MTENSDLQIENLVLRRHQSQKDKAEIDCLKCQIDSLTGHNNTK